MKKYVLHVKGWVILNANVPNDIINSSEVECVKLNFSYIINAFTVLFYVVP